MMNTPRTLALSVLMTIAMASLASPVALNVFANHLECSNGIDDDDDGRIDFPADPDCTDSSDNAEASGQEASASSSSFSSSFSSSSDSANAGMQLHITDGVSTVRPGGSLIYVITVEQNTQASRRVDVELTLPAQANTVSPEQGGIATGDRVRWENIVLTQGQEQRLTIQTNLNPSIPENTPLTARVTVDDAQATDTTTVRSSALQEDAFSLTLTDSRETAAPGERLSYTVTVRNRTEQEQTTDVILTYSQFVEVDTVTPQAPLESNLIVWREVTFAPQESRTFTFEATVRRSTPGFASASTQVRVGNANAVDHTSIQDDASDSSSSSSSSSSRRGTSRSSEVSDANNNVLFTKSSDTQEAFPGGTVRYTLFVQNVLLTPVTDAVVNDRFNPALLTTVADTGDATVIGPGQLQWRLPRLEPGQTWERSYTVRVAAGVHNGEILRTVASISGTGVGSVALEDRVLVATTDVVGSLPSTGAAFDLLFVLASLPLAGCAAGLQRRVRG